MTSILTPNENEYKDLADIYNRAHEPFLSIYSEEEREAFSGSLIETEDSIRKMAESRIIICAKDDQDQILGYVAFRKKNNITVWIGSLYVDPDHQRAGAGRVLLDAVEDFAKKENCKIIALETHQKAEWAINFYIKNGFEIVNDKINEFSYNQILDKSPVQNRPILAKILK